MQFCNQRLTVYITLFPIFAWQIITGAALSQVPLLCFTKKSIVVVFKGTILANWARILPKDRQEYGDTLMDFDLSSHLDENENQVYANLIIQFEL